MINTGIYWIISMINEYQFSIFINGMPDFWIRTSPAANWMKEILRET